MHKLAWIMKAKFFGWMQVNNFDQHDAGKIIVMWNASKVDFEPIGCSPQVIYYKIYCLISLKIVNISFIYGLHSIVSRRPLWSNIVDFGIQCSHSWLLLRDFNSVLSANERFNGMDVSTYEVVTFKIAVCLLAFLIYNSWGVTLLGQITPCGQNWTEFWLIRCGGTQVS